MLVDLHGIVLACSSSDPEIRQRWARSFSSRPRPAGAEANLTYTLERASHVPSVPAGAPVFTQGDLLSVYLAGSSVTIHFPRFGQIIVDLRRQEVSGRVVDAALDTYGVFEDMVAMGLAAPLRRRHLFLIHAFAAAKAGRALLLAGDIGSGKTTTGISLLREGWKLLSNDSPLLSAGGNAVSALSYPGLLSADSGTLARFPELMALANASTPAPAAAAVRALRPKISFAAESVYPDAWIASAPVRAIVFPHVAHRAEHEVTRLSQPEALRRLLPNAIDRWDTALIPEHLELLRKLAATAPAYRVELGDNIAGIPELLAGLLPD